MYPILDVDGECLAAAFRVQSPYGGCTALLAGYENDRYMRSDGWSGAGDDICAMLENYADVIVNVEEPQYDFHNAGITIRKVEPGYFEVEFKDKLLLTFRTCRMFETD